MRAELGSSRNSAMPKNSSKNCTEMFLVQERMESTGWFKSTSESWEAQCCPGPVPATLPESWSQSHLLEGKYHLENENLRYWTLSLVRTVEFTFHSWLDPNPMERVRMGFKP